MATATKTPQLVLRNIPARLKGKIARDADSRGLSMNDVLVEILAAAYGVPFETRGARRLKIGLSGQINLTLPDELKRQIAVDAAATGESERNVAVQIICEHYRVKFEPTGRWH